MKVIGIVGRAYYNIDNQEIIQTHDVIRRFLMQKEDVLCITLLPTEDISYLDIEPGSDYVNPKIDYLLNMCDAFVLPGGTYGYKFDEYVINHAIVNDKPLLGICLGFQVLCNLFAKNRNMFDMTTKTDLDSHYGPVKEYKHKITIKDNTILHKVIGLDNIPVNSCHHSIVNFELNELVCSSYSDDNILESVEYPNKKFIIGVEWHPEYLRDEYSYKLLDAFIDAIKK